MFIHAKNEVAPALSGVAYYGNRSRSYQFGEITQNTWPLRRSRSYKVTDFGTNRKPI